MCQYIKEQSKPKPALFFSQDGERKGLTISIVEMLLPTWELVLHFLFTILVVNKIKALFLSAKENRIEDMVSSILNYLHGSFHRREFKLRRTKGFEKLLSLLE
jgi:hypothetical protein